MRFDPISCPECGKPAVGTIEILRGQSELSVEEGGEAEYSGYTRVFWDDQKSAKDGDRWILVCENHHEWPAKGEGVDET